jgi:hypothetical protein
VGLEPTNNYGLNLHLYIILAFCNTRPIPGPAVLTPGSSLGSYIVPIDQHESFVRTLSSLMRTRENFPVGHPSQIALSQACLTWRFFRDKLPKKKMHIVCMNTLLIVLSLRRGYHTIREAMISHFLPVTNVGGAHRRWQLWKLVIYIVEILQEFNFDRQKKLVTLKIISFYDMLLCYHNGPCTTSQAD